MPLAHDSAAPQSRFDRALGTLRWIGIAGVLGGLIVLIAHALVAERPADQEQWRTMVRTMRIVFYSTVFAGIVILIPVGAILWRRRRAALRGRRWFRLMLAILVIAIPALHISARMTSHALQQAVDAADFEGTWTLWTRLTWLFAAALVVFTITTVIAKLKPPLGQR